MSGTHPCGQLPTGTVTSIYINASILWSDVVWKEVSSISVNNNVIVVNKWPVVDHSNKNERIYRY